MSNDQRYRPFRLYQVCLKLRPNPTTRALMHSQATREKEFYERMVAHLMAQIFFQETREAFSENIFRRHTTRPWNQRGGPVRGVQVKSCYFPCSPVNFILIRWSSRHPAWTTIIDCEPGLGAQYARTRAEQIRRIS